MRAKRDRDMEMISQYDLIEGHLQALTGSSVRTKVILSLRDGPKAVSELTRDIGASATTILHSVKALIDDSIVKRLQSKYELTNTGHVRALLLSELISGLAVLKENERFWQSHDLSGIPAHLLAGLGKLAGCTCVQDEPNDLLRSQQVFIESVSRAKSIWGVSPIIAPGYSDMVTDLLEQGASVSLVFTKSILKIIRPEKLQKSLASDNFKLFEIEDGIKVAFTVTDDSLFFGLYNRDGTYDALSDLVCCRPGAVDWGMKLFEFYQRQSRPVLK